MAVHSRRLFLTRASVGAAALGAAAIASPLTSSADAETVAGPTHDGPFVAWVKDAKSGDVAVMVGAHTVVHQDKKLAAQLARIAGTASQM